MRTRTYGSPTAASARRRRLDSAVADDKRPIATAPVAWAPVLALSSAFGVLSVAVAYAAARGGGTDETAYWLGLLLIVVPLAIRLLSARPSSTERLLLLLMGAFALYLVKVLHSPVAFTLHDEFSHLRTATDILEYGELFRPNPLLIASPFYPGLELLTVGLVRLTGLPIFEAGILIIGAARLLHVVALYLLYLRLSRSPRVAGVGTLLYAANPSFLFFDAAFSY